MLTWTILLLVQLFSLICSEEVKTQREILNKALEGYDLNDWPNAAFGRRTDVTVQLFINSFGSLNAANMEYSLDTFLRQSWNDPRLAFEDPNKSSITVTDEAMRNKIWKPDTYFENVKEASLHKVTMPNVLFRIEKNGDVIYSIRISMKLSCYMDFSSFPLDSQSCEVKISSYANTNSVIQYHWHQATPLDIPKNLEIAQFDLLTHETFELTKSYEVGNFSGVYAKFRLQRQTGFHILQTYIPTVLLVAISWVSFWLDPNSVPGRISLGVTTLLTITTLASGIRQQLPPVSYVKAIDIWVGMCMMMVFGALLEFTLSNFLANRKIPPGKTACKIPQFLIPCTEPEDDDKQKLENNLPLTESDKEPGTDSPPKAPTTYMYKAKALDRLCRALFPGTFLVFNLIYWPYYLLQQYKSVF